MKVRFWLELLAVYVLSVSVLALFQFQTPFLPETDGYFHIKFSALMRSHGHFFEGFPWTQFSMWKDQFSDSAYLFHLYLIPFTFFDDLAFGAKLATVLLGGGVFASFFVILKWNESKLPWVATLALLFAGGDLFFWRMNVPRPQILSVIVLLWTMHFLVNEKFKPFVVFCFLYPLSYVAGFLPAFFALALSVLSKLEGEKPRWKFPLYGLAACAASYVINPYFPKNTLMFWVQNVYVMWLAVTSHAQLMLGGEFLPVDTRTLLSTALPICLGFVAVAYLGLRGPKKLSRRTLRWAVPTLIVIFLSFCSRRFAEYSVPLSMLWLSLALTELASSQIFKIRPKAEKALKFAILGIVLTGASAITLPKLYRAYGDAKEAPLKDAALYLKEVARLDETVFTCDWDDGPELLYYNTAQNYLVMMDPTFLYYWNDKIYHAWRNATGGYEEAPDVYKIMKHIFKARFGVCTQDFVALRRIIGKSPEFKILKENSDFFLFQRVE